MPDQRLLFSKTGRARFISHLDLMRTFQRAFLRAGIAIKHTEGFNPHAFVSIALPLSVGYSSQCEILEFGLLEGAAAEEVPSRLNAVLPEGIHVLECYDAQRPVKALTWVDYAVELSYDRPAAGQAAQALTELLDRESLVVRKRSKKAKSGFVDVDLIPLIRSHTVSATENSITLDMVVRAQNPGLNPALLLEALPQALQPDFTGFCRRAVLDENGESFR